MENKFMSFAIIGTGAIGGYYGGLLARSGQKVHFLLHSTYHHINQHGLDITTINENFVLSKINCYQNVRDMPKCDVIIITLKTTQNNFLPTLLPHLVKDNSIILIMQNGLGNEEFVATICPHHAIFCALTTIGAIKLSLGKIKATHHGVIKLAPYNDLARSENLINNISNPFDKAGIPFEIHSDYLQIRWQKLLWNIPFNGLSVIQNSTSDQLAKNYIPLLKSIATEIITIAKAYDKDLSMYLFENMIEVTATLTGFKPSMLYDFEQQKPLEIEYIYANPLIAARKKAVGCPNIEKLNIQLKNLVA